MNKTPTATMITRARTWLKDPVRNSTISTRAPIFTDGKLVRHAWVFLPGGGVADRTFCGLIAECPTSARPGQVFDSSDIPDCEGCEDVGAHALARLLDEVRQDALRSAIEWCEAVARRSNEPSARVLCDKCGADCTYDYLAGGGERHCPPCAGQRSIVPPVAPSLAVAYECANHIRARARSETES